MYNIINIIYLNCEISDSFDLVLPFLELPFFSPKKTFQQLRVTFQNFIPR